MEPVSKPLLIIFCILFTLVAVPMLTEAIFSDHMKNKYQESLPYQKCVNIYLIDDQLRNVSHINRCSMDVDKPFIIYAGHDITTKRCFWRFSPLGKFADKNWPSCKVIELSYDSDAFDLEKFSTKNACQDRRYYLITPKKPGRFFIFTNSTCGYSINYAITVKDKN